MTSVVIHWFLRETLINSLEAGRTVLRFAQNRSQTQLISTSLKIFFCASGSRVPAACADSTWHKLQKIENRHCVCGSAACPASSGHLPRWSWHPHGAGTPPRGPSPADTSLQRPSLTAAKDHSPSRNKSYRPADQPDATNLPARKKPAEGYAHTPV